MKRVQYLETETAFLIAPLILVLLAVFLEYSSFDLWWVSHFYDRENLLWPFQKHWLFKGVLHTGGRRFIRLIGALWLLGFIGVTLKKKWRRYRKDFLYMLCATITGPIIVGIGKATTHIHAPWDLALFAGTAPYIRIFDPVPGGTGIGHAFPAGHASSGYCFFSIYFLLLRYESGYRFKGLLTPLLLGALFGLAQQIRGAHFPSHDLFTAALCWYGCLGMYRLFYPDQWRAHPEQGRIIRN